MSDDEKIAVIAALAVTKMQEEKIPAAMSYDVAETIFKQFKEKGAKLPPGFTANLTMKIKALLK